MRLPLYCNQCSEGPFESEAARAVHLLSVHGLNENPSPQPRSLANLYDIMEGLAAQVKEMADRAELEYQAIDLRLEALDSRLEDLEEPDE